MDQITEYVAAVKTVLALKGLQTASAANHRALELGLITLDQFQAAARMLADFFLSQDCRPRNPLKEV